MDSAITPSSETSGTFTEKSDPHARRSQKPEGIEGWGADLDPANRPAVPMERTPPRLHNVHWDAPEAQQAHVKIHHSIERPGITPVFGTSAPPTGLSGRMRDLAFRYSENDLRHWLILLAADRVNVGEGLLEDLSRGHIPNIFAEMGGPAEWRHNRAGFYKKAAIAGGVVALAVVWMRRKREPRFIDE
jgi:hypothetical protein